jgi:hypothetical protein
VSTLGRSKQSHRKYQRINDLGTIMPWKKRDTPPALRCRESGAESRLRSGGDIQLSGVEMLDDHIDRPVDGAKILTNDLKRVPS